MSERTLLTGGALGALFGAAIGLILGVAIGRLRRRVEPYAASIPADERSR